ncbi:hypothetical protein M409DRAFT_56058 [Zasmidium cellare ATCC 36951]|uniref:Uncharacterized protein n=1 Tax=Zasmidium cellare ATCC 36951 TaxID=1080233 RepID=A0A6A6CG43_ZASCE|nr:uncharacterized protein M409DRAFT_56058 [Zasmidium cellare ATCC 36951]KAF2165180.1 hypothetical protein M409DRAFT_56058 [Zasmidium cellare ATCC 36951]
MVTGAATTSFSSLSGPWLTARSWEWKSVYSRVTVGTVLVTVDQITNQTVTSTSYNSDHLQFVTSGTFSGPDLHTRTDTDAAGTVTGVVYDGSEKLTVTYPTDYLAAGTRLTYNAILPTFTANRTCCHSTETFVPIPSHESPLPTSTASTQSEDPSGIYYQLVPVNDYFSPDDISHLWMGRNLAPPYSGCPFTMCPSSNTTTAAPAYSATWQNAQAYLLATSTTTLSSVGADGGGGNGGGTTTTPEAQQGPTTTPTNTSPQADQDSQAGNTLPTTPTPTPPEQGPSTPTSPTEPDQHSQGGGSPPDTTPTQSPDVNPPGGQPTGGQPTGGQSPSGDNQPPPPAVAPVITIGASPITANSADQYVVDDQTLAPGSAIEVSGTTYSLPSAGSPVVTAPPVGAPASLPTFTVGGSAVTANSASEYVIGGETLAPGSAVVVSGTTISLASDASQLVVGSSTVSGAAGTPATTSSTGTGTGSDSASASSSQTPATQNSANGRMRISLSQVCLMTALLLFSMI